MSRPTPPPTRDLPPFGHHLGHFLFVLLSFFLCEGKDSGQEQTSPRVQIQLVDAVHRWYGRLHILLGAVESSL